LRNPLEDITKEATPDYTMESNVFKWTKKFTRGKNFRILQYKDA